jgi:hypothetical protein
LVVEDVLEADHCEPSLKEQRQLLQRRSEPCHRDSFITFWQCLEHGVDGCLVQAGTLSCFGGRRRAIGWLVPSVTAPPSSTLRVPNVLERRPKRLSLDVRYAR